MVTPNAAGSFAVEAKALGAVGLVLLSASSERIVIAGYHGAVLPNVVTDPCLSPRNVAGVSSAWTLACAEGSFDFAARTVERLERRPHLFDTLLVSYALRPRERFAARWLLKLMRLPGGARLLHAWHARRR